MFFFPIDRSNNFFHGIWRIPINEIDRPGCFAAHMGRSIALLLEVLRESRDHRLLMELALALQPEPEADKKYLFDCEREQHASLALSLMGQVLRGRLQEIKDSIAPPSSDGFIASSVQQVENVYLNMCDLVINLIDRLIGFFQNAVFAYGYFSSLRSHGTQSPRTRGQLQRDSC